jgi:hypothetical protein
MAKLMLFGDLKGGGTLTIDSKDDKIVLVVKPKIKVTDETAVIDPN